MGHTWGRIYEAAVSDTEQQERVLSRRERKQAESWRHITDHGTAKNNSRKSRQHQEVEKLSS